MSAMSRRPVTIKYIIITSAILILYFAILSVTGLMHYSGLRMVNYLLMAMSLYLAFKEIKAHSLPGDVSFLEVLGTGFMIVLGSAALFSIFVLIFGMYISPSIINAVWRNPFYHNTTANAMAMAAYIFSETLFLGIILDLIIAQFFKWGMPPESEEE